jgi:hypothetical protein
MKGVPLRAAPPDLQKLITGPRGICVKAIADHDAKEKEVCDLAEKISEWGEKKERLEKTADPADERTCAEIARLQTQIRIGERRLSEREAADFDTALASGVNSALEVFRVVHPRECSAVIKAASDAVESYCRTRTDAEGIAQTMPVVQNYQTALSNFAPYGVSTFTLAKRALAALDLLAAGNWPWPVK